MHLLWHLSPATFHSESQCHTLWLVTSIQLVRLSYKSNSASLAESPLGILASDIHPIPLAVDSPTFARVRVEPHKSKVPVLLWSLFQEVADNHVHGLLGFRLSPPGSSAVPGRNV